jgi:hypothetical protein
VIAEHKVSPGDRMTWVYVVVDALTKIPLCRRLTTGTGCQADEAWRAVRA